MTDLDFPIKYPALNVEFEKAKVILQDLKTLSLHGFFEGFIDKNLTFFNVDSDYLL